MLKAYATIIPDNEYVEGATHRWSFCYLHGNAEFEYDTETSGTPDLFLADAYMPKEAGNYLVSVRGEPAIAVITKRHGMLNGRIALVSDSEALIHALNVEAWR